MCCVLSAGQSGSARYVDRTNVSSVNNGCSVTCCNVGLIKLPSECQFEVLTPTDHLKRAWTSLIKTREELL